MSSAQAGFICCRVEADDGAAFDLRLSAPSHARQGLYLLPALGVGARPMEAFAQALAERGMAVAIHEWRGLGSSNRRAARDCDWGYRELLELDIPAGLDAARAQLPGLGWSIAGHSLGGQMALLSAARMRSPPPSVHLLASGLPDWRVYPQPRGLGIWAALHLLPSIAVLWGHYPGEALGFAGREARGVMRDWGYSGRAGSYRVRDSEFDPEAALCAFSGRVQALHLEQDWLCPRASLDPLQAKTPQAHWRIETIDARAVHPRRADHFGWLKASQAVAERVHAFAMGALLTQ
jgi:predicted alpha/beta hydrolase